MNIIISEHQFRLLTEALARKNVLSDTVFVSYGTDKLDLDNVKPVETGNCPLHYRTVNYHPRDQCMFNHVTIACTVT